MKQRVDKPILSPCPFELFASLASCRIFQKFSIIFQAEKYTAVVFFSSKFVVKSFDFIYLRIKFQTLNQMISNIRDAWIVLCTYNFSLLISYAVFQTMIFFCDWLDRREKIIKNFTLKLHYLLKSFFFFLCWKIRYFDLTWCLSLRIGDCVRLTLKFFANRPEWTKTMKNRSKRKVLKLKSYSNQCAILVLCCSGIIVLILVRFRIRNEGKFTKQTDENEISHFVS